jgi:hypothetical protein
MPFRGQARWAKMTSLGYKLTPLAYHPTKKVKSAEELTKLSINLEMPFRGQAR